MTIHFHVCGSTEYLKKHGIPKTAKDLDKHARQALQSLPSGRLFARLQETLARELAEGAAAAPPS